VIKLPFSVRTTFGNEVSDGFARAIVFSITERGQEVQTHEDLVEVAPRITDPVPALETFRSLGCGSNKSRDVKACIESSPGSVSHEMTGS
jgi:hypothetical protein